MDKIPIVAGVKSVEKKLDSKDDLLGANQELDGRPPRLLRDEPGGDIWTGCQLHMRSVGVCASWKGVVLQ